jgi:hypothetical protein
MDQALYAHMNNKRKMKPPPKKTQKNQASILSGCHAFTEVQPPHHMVPTHWLMVQFNGA